MQARRPLIDGLKTAPEVPAEAITEFVYGTKPPGEALPETAAGTSARESDAPRVAPPARVAALSHRVPLTTRFRPEVAAALKRASLERQLAGEAPHTVQEILEEALEPWLRIRGYLA